MLLKSAIFLQYAIFSKQNQSMIYAPPHQIHNHPDLEKVFEYIPQDQKSQYQIAPKISQLKDQSIMIYQSYLMDQKEISKDKRDIFMTFAVLYEKDIDQGIAQEDFIQSRTQLIQKENDTELFLEIKSQQDLEHLFPLAPVVVPPKSRSFRFVLIFAAIVMISAWFFQKYQSTQKIKPATNQKASTIDQENSKPKSKQACPSDSTQEINQHIRAYHLWLNHPDQDRSQISSCYSILESRLKTAKCSDIAQELISEQLNTKLAKQPKIKEICLKNTCPIPNDQSHVKALVDTYSQWKSNPSHDEKAEISCTNTYQEKIKSKLERDQVSCKDIISDYQVAQKSFQNMDFELNCTTTALDFSQFKQDAMMIKKLCDQTFKSGNNNQIAKDILITQDQINTVFELDQNREYTINQIFECETQYPVDYSMLLDYLRMNQFSFKNNNHFQNIKNKICGKVQNQMPSQQNFCTSTP